MSKIRILITTTSFQDTPGRHHDLLAGDAYDIERARGPLPESAILALVGDYDAILCGDDALTRQIPRHDAIVKRGEWHRGVGHELAGKTLGLLGLGRIGREVAQRAVAFAMRVCAYDVSW